MTRSRVLAHLARRFTVSEENLATEALTYLLQASPIARAAMNDLARDLGADLPPNLQYVGQVGADGVGRPDIVGIDMADRERLILEAKFGAGLTEQQPGGYLARITHGASGMVLVVAPSVRLPSLWRELLAEVALPYQPEAVQLRHVKVGVLTTLAFVSWRDVVTRVRDALRAKNEVDLSEDAEQLLALTEVMDSGAYLPARHGEFSQRAGQLVHQNHHRCWIRPALPARWVGIPALPHMCLNAALSTDRRVVHSKVFRGSVYDAVAGEVLPSVIEACRKAERTRA
ncbi:hypothetical protein ACIBCL_25160 [Micromonospora zamorensis]|uniref:hypothetical protein n=1 Tax=Micromonospora zamorensis TaxID=709883 RepID=UPI0037A78598